MSSSCTIPGCKNTNQISAGIGHSTRYCKHHIEFHRRHGSYWFRSLTATELKPHRKTARALLRSHEDEFRISRAISSIEGLMQNAGPWENAYSIRGRPPKERANFALARLRKSAIDPKIILERILAVALCCQARGIDERQREYRQVQMAKVVHRLASGTHKTTSGFPIPSKYPRSEGNVLRHLGRRLDAIAAFALDGHDGGASIA